GCAAQGTPSVFSNCWMTAGVAVGARSDIGNLGGKVRKQRRWAEASGACGQRFGPGQRAGASNIAAYPRGLKRAALWISAYSDLTVLLAMAQPAVQQRADVLRPMRQQALRGVAHRWQQVGIAHQVGDLELQQAGLSGAEHLARATQLQILFGDD